jgi:RNA 2',3'-cyclic 3'-phosphodiesterase
MVEGVATRIFVAVPLPDEVRMALAARLEPLDMPGKVVAAENWHITLRFLGWTDDVAFDRMLAALDESDLGSSFNVMLGGMGAFPRPKSATVIWLAVSEGLTRLEELAAMAEEAAQRAGFGPEERPFRAHLTLSRVRPAEDASDLLDSFRGADLGWRCGSVVVYRSHLGRGGTRYEPLETFSLTR